MSQISEMLSREEVMEKQRSRIGWLQAGDRNTPFFQAKSKERAKTNRIVALKRADDTVVTAQHELETTATDFYAELFTSQGDLEIDPIINCIPTKVTTEMNDMLIRPFSGEEVKRALFMMGANKAPGLDGLTAGFYQAHWSLIGPSITDVVLDFLNGGNLPEIINKTTIVLIPKVMNP